MDKNQCLDTSLEALIFNIIPQHLMIDSRRLTSVDLFPLAHTACETACIENGLKIKQPQIRMNVRHTHCTKNLNFTL